MIRFLVALAVLSLASMTFAQSPMPSSGSAQHWSPDAIPWERAGPDGTKFALLEGRRDVPGMPFSYAFFVPAGGWDSPHWHSATARVFVVKGTLKLGYGDTLNKTTAISYPAGSYVIVPAGAVHFDGADEDMIIIGTAIGPWSTTYLDGAKPASAGTPVH